MNVVDQLIWILILAAPVSCITWTFTHEEIFKEIREHFISLSKTSKVLIKRKFFYLFTCEYCFSHYITLFIMALSGFKLLVMDWRGLVISFFAIVWVANIYMSVYQLIRLKIKSFMNDSPHVQLNCTYLAAPEIVFDAWINKDLISKWLFVGPTSEIVDINIDLKENGKFSIVEQEKYSREFIHHYGKYLVINRPNKLIFTLSVPKHFTNETQVEIYVSRKDIGCELKLVQTGVTKSLTEGNWLKMLHQLKLTLENQ